MALIKLRLDVANEVQLSRAFETGRLGFVSLERPYGEMIDEFYQSMTQVFAKEGAYENRKRWQELSPAYAAWKARYYPGKKILEKTGRLKRSLTIRGGEDGVAEITKDSLSVGTKVPYAIKHQLGSKGLPIRKIIELTDDQKKRWVRIMHIYLYDLAQEMARVAGGGS